MKFKCKTCGEKFWFLLDGGQCERCFKAIIKPSCTEPEATTTRKTYGRSAKSRRGLVAQRRNLLGNVLRGMERGNYSSPSLINTIIERMGELGFVVVRGTVRSDMRVLGFIVKDGKVRRRL